MFCQLTQFMTRPQKIQKLANVVKEYRGSCDERTGKWMRPPRPHAAQRILVWLERLKLPPEPTMERINGFAHVSEFRAWIQSV